MSADCKHENFKAQVNVARLTKDEGADPYAFVAEITIKCVECLTPMKFLGVGVGMSPLEPLTDVAATELRAPIVPVGQEEMVGTLGYRVTARTNKPRVIE